jgi:hypothetical protein
MAPNEREELVARSTLAIGVRLLNPIGERCFLEAGLSRLAAWATIVQADSCGRCARHDVFT